MTDLIGWARPVHGETHPIFRVPDTSLDPGRVHAQIGTGHPAKATTLFRPATVSDLELLQDALRVVHFMEADYCVVAIDGVCVGCRQ